VAIFFSEAAVDDMVISQYSDQLEVNFINVVEFS
jgi:hypothetical protein